jgi:hypothetical protein
VKPSKERPVVLLDSHDLHLLVAALDFCKEKGVTVVFFPPHCSHKLQPLDRSVCGPLKPMSIVHVTHGSQSIQDKR